MVHVPCQRAPGLGPSRHGARLPVLRRPAMGSAGGGCADHTGRPCQYVGMCQHAGMADGARGHVGRNEMDPLLCGSTAMSHNEFQSSEPIEPQEASPMKQEMHVLGIDIAKRVFHAVGMDDRGNVVYRKRLSRHDLMPCI